MLKQSVARLKGEPGSDRIHAEVKLDFVTNGERGAPARRTSGSFSFAAIKEAEYTHRSEQSIQATLPTDYISEPRLRIDFYRRLALAETLETVQAISEELNDRFGKSPQSVQTLIEVSRIRVMAEEAGVRRVENENERLICHLAQPGAEGGFLKSGTRFPRLSSPDPHKRLLEIQQLLKRHRKPEYPPKGKR